MHIEDNIRKEINNTFGIEVELDKCNLKSIIDKLKRKENLSENEVVIAMSSLMSNDVSKDDIALYLKYLHEKGETVDEIAISASVMRIFATKIYNVDNKEKFKNIEIVDCCGTGGGINIFNISTIISFILAAGGLYVAKHGNRAITSRSGSADIIEALGAKIDIPANKVGECIINTRMGFLFAPHFHQATKNVQKVRRSIKHRTIFNILGPLTNPANPTYQIIGVYDKNLTEKIVKVLKLLKVKRAIVVHGFTPCGKGMDEVSTLGRTQVSELLMNGGISNYIFSLNEIGLSQTTIENLKCSNIDENVKVVRKILTGSITGPRLEIVLLNAAFGFMASNRVKNVQEGFDLSLKLINNGECKRVLNNFIHFTNEIK